MPRRGSKSVTLSEDLILRVERYIRERQFGAGSVAAVVTVATEQFLLQNGYARAVAPPKKRRGPGRPPRA